MSEPKVLAPNAIKIRGTVSKIISLETILVASIVAIVAVINAQTATLYPLVWLDEVMYSDPAIHLINGRGFTSTAWYSVTFDHFWYGNTPLHSLLLALWGKVFGLRLESVRVFGHVLAAISVIIIWISLKRLRIGSITLRVLFLLLFLTEYAVAFAYRSGRPDAICLLVAAMLLGSITFTTPKSRGLALALSASLVTWAGLQLMVALVFAGGVLWYARRDFRPEILAAGVGIVLGGLALLAFYAVNDSLWLFLNATIVSMHTIAGQAGRLVALGDHRLLDRLTLSTLLDTILQDRSQVILLATIGILTIILGSREAYRSGLIAVGIGISFPLYMALAGKYPLYYAWMGFALVWVASLPLFDESLRDVRSSRIAVIGLGLAIAVGLPLQLGVAFYQRDQRDYSAVQDYVGRNVHPGEWVYATSPAYFAALDSGAFVLSGSYTGSRLSPEIPIDQRERLTTIIASPQEFPKVRELVGGYWVPTSGVLRTGEDGEGKDPHHLDQVYYLQAYRRKAQ